MKYLNRITQWLRGILVLCIAAPFSHVLAIDAKFEAMLAGLLRHNVAEVRTREIRNQKNFVFLDARSRREYDVSHIPNAIWIGYEDFTPERMRGIAKDADLVVYCSVGYRSEIISGKLIRQGYHGARNYVGGIFDWVNQDGKVINKDGAITREIHGYNRKWGIWLKKGKIVYE